MPHYTFAVALSTLLAVYALRKKSLSKDGAAGAFALGMVTFSSNYWLFTVVLLIKADRKRLLEEDYEKSSERTIIQVICNGLVAGIVVTMYQMTFESQNTLTCFDDDKWSTVLIWTYIGHYACCAGDTWASEIGILNKTWPVLITTFKRVPPGTNGGISQLGLLASFGGGATMGLAAAITLALEQRCHGFAYEIMLVGAAAGLVGSLIDSLLGATVQRTLYSKKEGKIVGKASDKNVTVISGIDILDNHQVNFVCSVVTSALCGLAAWYIY
ncbi:hypothetical protein INT44_004947 [Umbelopsis vinacea]|uniref:Transmembrane protein 19 n=1 Tax=Umbelopsis vinacea TaxID=44442 RepID=A0A8H7Q777_9FUNG|nr:hypothetical protein INT44_004947 [Umbelopsis vinacea]KAI9285846.1 integral membrane protein DUF92-domain-containing protein [Umbelopsis sp. AD052]